MNELETPVTQALRALLAGATEPVTASPVSTRVALDGGRARLRRRRTRAAVTLGLVLAVAAGLAGPGLAGHRAGPEPADPTFTQPPDPADPYQRLLTGPGRGDLISDGRFTEAAFEAWAQPGNGAGERVGRLVGQARIVWAGQSPAGPAAVMVQRTELRAEDPGSGGRPARSTAIGFLGVDSDGRPRVVARSVWPRSPDTDQQAAVLSGVTGAQAWFVDPEQTVLGVLDVGTPVGYGTRWTYRPDGTRTMALTPLTMHEGAAFVRLPLRGAAGYPVRVARLPADRPGQDIVIAGQPMQANPSGTGWARPDGQLLRLDLGPADDQHQGDQQALADRFRQALEQRTTPLAAPGGQLSWTAAGRLPDGPAVVLGESRLLPDPARVYLALLPGSGGAQVVDAGPVPPAGTVPRIRVPLPGGRGWAVAEYAAGLRWRSGAGPWSAGQRDAALVPAGATELEVTRPGRPAVLVPLTDPALSAGR